jgi:acyl-ACP thioesterase
MRLDALARWLQDIAYLDVDDAGVAHLAVWVVRRSRISVGRFPRFAEHLEVETFCSGLGRMWAERRTRVREPDGATLVEAAALWVHLDPATWRPAPFTPEETGVYGNHASGRRISARLRHPAPPPGAPERPWEFHATDCDIADHVNNAAYWQPLEEELLAGPEPGRLELEIEFRGPAQPGTMRVLGAGGMRWILNADGETHASILIDPAPAAPPEPRCGPGSR